MVRSQSTGRLPALQCFTAKGVGGAVHAAYQLQVAEVDAIRPSHLARKKLHRAYSPVSSTASTVDTATPARPQSKQRPLSRPHSSTGSTRSRCSTVSTADTSDFGDDSHTTLPPINTAQSLCISSLSELSKGLIDARGEIHPYLRQPMGFAKQRRRRCSDSAICCKTDALEASLEQSPRCLAVQRPASSPHHSKFRDQSSDLLAASRPASSPQNSKHNIHAQLASCSKKLPGEQLFASTPECCNIKVQWLGEGMVTKHECSVCCDDLCNRSVVLLLGKDGRRSCPHFLHSQCCRVLEQRAKAFGDEPFCPVCQVPFSGYVPIPKPFEDAKGWYAALDVTGSHNVSHSRFVDALQATTNIKPRLIEKIISSRRWHDGAISPQECEELLLHVEQNFQAKTEKAKVPIVEQRQIWFHYWDVDGTGLLSQEEMTRALLKTLREFDAFSIHEAVANVWPEVDEFNSGLVDLKMVLSEGSGLLDRVIKYASTSSNKRKNSKLRKAVFNVMSSKKDQHGKGSAKRHASCPTGARQELLS